MKNLFLLLVGLMSCVLAYAQPDGWTDPCSKGLVRETSIIADGSTVYYLKNETVGGWFVPGNKWWTHACVTKKDAEMPSTSPYGCKIRFSDSDIHSGYLRVQCMTPDSKLEDHNNKWFYVFDISGINTETGLEEHSIYTDYLNQGVDRIDWKFSFKEDGTATFVSYLNPLKKVGLESSDGITPTFYEDDASSYRSEISQTGAYTMNNTGSIVATSWSLWSLGGAEENMEYKVACDVLARLQQIHNESGGKFIIDDYSAKIGEQLGTRENAERLISLLAQINADYFSWRCSKATGDNPIVVDLINPGFETGSMDGWKAERNTFLYEAQSNKEFDNVQGDYYAEFWHKTGSYSAQQTVKGLPEGVYKLSAYVYSGNNAAVLFMNDVVSERIGVSKKYSISIELAKDVDTISLGVRSSDNGDAWNCVDEFSLTYYGNDGKSYATLFEETYANKASYIYQQGLQEKLAVLTAATTKDEIKTAYHAAKDYEDQVIAENVKAWEDYNQIVKDAQILISNINYAELSGKLSAIIQKRWKLRNTETDPTTSELLDDPNIGYNVIKAECDRLISIISKGTDVTESLVKNYDFSQDIVGINSGNATMGWRIDGNKGEGGWQINTSAKCGECWNGNDFDFYQIIENAPVGIYQITAQSFTRAGRDNTSWGYYHDQQTGELLDNPVFGDWTPNEAHIYLNDNTGNLSISYAYPHAVEEGFFDSGYYQDPLGLNQYPDDMHSAGLAFANGDYKVSVISKVEKSGDKLRIGIKGNNYGLDNWTCFSNFRLIYLGSFVAHPKIVRVDNTNELTITTETSGATIYYTMDGTDPTEVSPIYDINKPIVVTGNCIIKAIAEIERTKSSMSTFTVDWFTVSDVTIRKTEGLEFEMITETEGATIRYTLDGSDPDEKSNIYYGKPIGIDEDCTIKAIGMKNNYNNSNISTFDLKWSDWTCPKPTFRLSGAKLYIESTMEDVVIYYTLDGETPTSSSLQYTLGEPLEITFKCTVKAIVTKKGYRDSEVESYEIKGVDAIAPEFVLDEASLTLTIKCKTEGAKIYYGIGDNAELNNLYKAPIKLTDNRVIYAIAKKEEYNDSPIAEFKHNLITCEPATLEKYDGRYFTLSVPEGATAYYTLDGSVPTVDSEKYTGLAALTGICTIKTIAVCDWKNDSEVKSIDITYFSDDESAAVTEEGQLQQSMEWQDANKMRSLKVSGPLNATDLTYIKTELASVEHLDLENTTIAGNTLPDEAFAGMQSLISFTSPKNITTAGERILANCPQLAAVIWNPLEKLKDSTFGDTTNPNMLVYVVNTGFAPSNVRNRVVNGTATVITLSDEEGYSNFYCPKPFTAKKISYTHEYSMETGYEKCKGWETISLPFTVQKVTHAKGELMSFKQFEEAGSPEEGRPFWLRTLTDNDFEDASTIEAYIPYIISMPNNKEYASRYNIAGNVTFSAENVEIGITEPVVRSKNGISFVSCFQKKSAGPKIWPLNVKQESEGYLEGSAFLQSLRDVKPFEAYATTEVSNARAVLSLSEMMSDNNITDIDMILCDRSRDNKEVVKVYNITGTLLKTGKRDEVVKQLPVGLYIINGEKVYIK